jgi:hypothetical protein
MIKVMQENCRASEDIMTALMSEAVRAGAEVVLIQEPSVKNEEDKWMVKIRDGNYVYIYSGDNDRPYVLTAVRKDVVWNDYGGSRNAERVGIEIGNTRIINIYHHREKRMDMMNIMQELVGIDTGNGCVPETSTVTIASGMVMEESQQEVGAK